MKLMGALVASYALTGVLAAQPSLRITSPADGTIVHPGETLIVTVEASPTDAHLVGIMVGARDPLGFAKPDPTGRPDRFTFHIPNNATPGKYAVNAGAITPSKEFIYANSINILIERADSPVSLTVYPVIADFTMDQNRYFSVTGLYADKTEVDLSQSSRIKYVSSNPQIATVQEQGIVSPVQPGRATITITYDTLTITAPVRVREPER